LVFIFLFLKVDNIRIPISWGNDIKIIKDTVIIERYYAADTVFVTKPKIIYRNKTDTLTIIQRDTFIQITNVEGFVASDSFVTKKKDTFKINYIYPENFFRYTINYSPDTIKQIKVDIQKEDKEWKKYLEYGLMGVAVGIIIRSIIK